MILVLEYILISGIESTDEFRNPVAGHTTCELIVENKIHGPFPHSINKL